MGRPRLPLTELERLRVRRGLVVAGALLLVGVVLAVLAVRAGDVRLALVTLTIPLVYLLAVLAAPLRTMWLTVVLYALVPLSAGFVLGFPVLGIVVAIAVVAVLVLGSARGLDAVPASLRPLEETRVDPGAVTHVAAFEEHGFRPVGAYAFEPASGHEAVVTVLVGPRREEYALVTDLVLDVVSFFGSRLFITANSAAAALPPEYLPNVLRGAEADELLEAHRRGLDLLRERGLRPDPIDPERLLETQLALERRCGDWALRGGHGRILRSLFASGVGPGPLDGGASSRERIETWLSASSPILAPA